MSRDPHDCDAVMLARSHGKTEKIERNPLLSIAIDEQTIPDARPEHQPTCAELIRLMSASFRRERC